MFSLLERLRKKSKNTRRVIALGTSIGVTAIIFVFWVSGIYLHGVSGPKDVASSGGGPSPFKVIRDQASDFVAGVGGVFSEVNNIFEGSVLNEVEESTEELDHLEEEMAIEDSVEESGGYKEKEEDENTEIDIKEEKIQAEK